MTRAPQLSSPLGLLLGLALSTSCWNRAGDHCANLAGDQTCAERGAGAFCDACAVANDGCIDVMPAGDCHFAGSGEGSSTSSTSNDGEAPAEETTLETGTASSVTTGPLPSCASAEDCSDLAAPFCGSGGECVGCDEMNAPNDACASLDPELPVCANGTCVQCTAADLSACSGMTTPVCDDVTKTCVCTEHEHCRQYDDGGPACNFFTGECLPADAVVHVGPGQEFATLTNAVASFGMGAEGTIVVHQHTDVYEDAVVVDVGRVLAFLASPGDQPSWDNGVNPARQLTVTDGTVLIDGLTLLQYGNIDDPGAVLVDGGRAWIDHSRITDNSGGVRAENGAALILRNCFVEGANDTIAVDVNDASALLLYSTVATSTFGSTPALSCTAPVAVEIRNSIIVSQGGTSPDELSCSGASVTDSATEADVGSFNIGWFNDFNGGDFHLTAMGALVFSDIAQWQLGDPLTDIDGDPRPAVDGTPDYAGADVP